MSFLFGHEGENSLLSYLKSEGFANELVSSYNHHIWSFSEFYVEIYLTEKGFQNIDKCTEIVF
jgi:insulysin